MTLRNKTLFVNDGEIGYISDHDDQSFGMFCAIAIVSPRINENEYKNKKLKIVDDEVGYISDDDDQSFGMFCAIATVFDGIDIE